MDQRSTQIKKKFKKRPTIKDTSQKLPHHNPPIFHVSPSEFKDLVQKLTGLPSTHTNNIIFPSNPPPLPPLPPEPMPPTTNTRLQLLRPPPLAHINNNPMQVLNNTTEVLSYPTNTVESLSPLPPLPTVHAALESPVSSYMRNLREAMVGAGETGELEMASSSVGFYGSSDNWFQQQQPLYPNVQEPYSGGNGF